MNRFMDTLTAKDAADRQTAEDASHEFLRRLCAEREGRGL